MTPGEIEQDVFIKAPAQTVWDVLTLQIERWYAFGGAEVDLRPGGTMVLRFEEPGDYRAVVETVEPGVRFGFRMAQHPGEPVEPSTRVEFRLIPTGSRTKVQLVETGVPASVTGAARAGWTSGLKDLQAIAEGAEPGSGPRA